MKTTLLTAALVLFVAGSAMAEPVNVGGALLVHGNEAALSFCPGTGVIPTDCIEGGEDGFLTRIDKTGAPLDGYFTWVVLAVFPENAVDYISVRTIEFGIEWEGLNNPANPALAIDAIVCGDFFLETESPQWPASGSGITISWTDELQTDRIFPVVEFMGLNAEGETGYFMITDHPSGRPASFTDGELPATITPAAQLGTLGFLQDGDLPCPSIPEGACCVGPLDHLVCEVMMEFECAEVNGIWLGDEFELCDPDPCPAIPVFEGSWGSIKATYR